MCSLDGEVSPLGLSGDEAEALTSTGQRLC